MTNPNEHGREIDSADADRQHGTSDTGQATEATFFDPFADDDADSGTDSSASPASSDVDDGDDEDTGGQSTQATPFDPFADDSDGLSLIHI